jgi:hypothetical protein
MFPILQKLGKVVDQPRSEAVIQYNLPLRWSLSYALTDKQWRGLRDRHKKLHPDWEHCDCPKRCKSHSLDEHWDYDHATHTKAFSGAKYICQGCHWLKSPGFRLSTWLSRPALSGKAPHIIACLGWTQERVDALRVHDLKDRERQATLIARQQREVGEGRAAIVATPLERVQPDERERLTRVQIVIVPWNVDLSRLSVYGYTREEIGVFEERMYGLAAKRMIN